eukprot:3976244-Prymnesium_polylepis.1
MPQRAAQTAAVTEQWLSNAAHAWPVSGGGAGDGGAVGGHARGSGAGSEQHAAGGGRTALTLMN